MPSVNKSEFETQISFLPDFSEYREPLIAVGDTARIMASLLEDLKIDISQHPDVLVSFTKLVLERKDSQKKFNTEND